MKQSARSWNTIFSAFLNKIYVWLLALLLIIYDGDLNDRKSWSGSIIFLNNGPTIWLGCKQSCMASSTTESEYVVVSLTSKKIVWARRFLAYLGFSQPKTTPFLFDNQFVIRLALNPKFHKWKKYIDVLFHLIREFQARGDIFVSYVPTRLQLVGILTKALTPDTFHKWRFALNLSMKVLHQWENLVRNASVRFWTMRGSIVMISKFS